MLKLFYHGQFMSEGKDMEKWVLGNPNSRQVTFFCGYRSDHFCSQRATKPPSLGGAA
jgi:hypothetical protein